MEAKLQSKGFFIMAFCELKIFSEALHMQTEVYVIIPQRSTAGEIGTENKESKGKYKCLYLLHGLSDDHTIWMRRTSIERYATKYGIAVVMPRADRSFYTDMKYGPAYYTYVAEELPRIITDLFPISDKREDNTIGGLSMGGYGAMKIALRNPDSFSKIIALSSVADIRALYERFEPTLNLVFGTEQGVTDEDDLFALTEKMAKLDNRPEIFMAVGQSDFMYNENLKLRDHIKDLGYDLTYREGPGIHGWDFWDEYIQYGLEWAYL